MDRPNPHQLSKKELQTIWDRKYGIDEIVDSAIYAVAIKKNWSIPRNYNAFLKDWDSYCRNKKLLLYDPTIIRACKISSDGKRGLRRVDTIQNFGERNSAENFFRLSELIDGCGKRTCRVNPKKAYENQIMNIKKDQEFICDYIDEIKCKTIIQKWKSSTKPSPFGSL